MTPIIASCQFEPETGAVDRNIETIREIAGQTPDETALAVFPELAVTGYDLQAAVDSAQPVPGALTDRLVDIAAAAGTWLVVGLAERVDETVYNDLVCVSPQGVEASYRKRYPWGDEAAVFGTGGEPVTVETPVGTVGFLLCYDLNFPEAALGYVREEVDILAVSAAWRASYRADWELLLRARALDGTCYAVGVNHAGEQHGRTHEGGSLVAGPNGTMLDRVGDGRAVADVAFDESVLGAARERNPVLRTRRE